MTGEPEDVPPLARVVGPQLDDTSDGAWDDPWASPGNRPLVLVGLSSTVMR